MKKYVKKNTIKAKPMKKRDFINKFFDKVEDQSTDDSDGYFIKKKKGIPVWMPKALFENKYIEK